MGKYGGKRVWRFIGGRYNEVLLYSQKCFQNLEFLDCLSGKLQKTD